MHSRKLFAVALAVAACSCAGRARPVQPPAFVDYSQLTWNKIVPDLGAKSPEIAILHVDPTTQATDLMIRTPAAIHVRRHWHTANETHTIIRGRGVLACDGRRAELGPGGFNFMPAKMVHEAWIAAGTLAFITVDRASDINIGPGTSTGWKGRPRRRT